MVRMTAEIVNDQSRVTVARKHWIMNSFNNSMANHHREALQEDHSGSGKCGKVERLLQFVLGVTQYGERQMQSCDHLLLVGSVLHAEPSHFSR